MRGMTANWVFENVDGVRTVRSRWVTTNNVTRIGSANGQKRDVAIPHADAA